MPAYNPPKKTNPRGKRTDGQFQEPSIGGFIKEVASDTATKVKNTVKGTLGIPDAPPSRKRRG